MKTALITGVTGQDGCYLTKLLLGKGYAVVGMIDPTRNSNLSGLKHVGALPVIELQQCDLLSFTDVQRVILQTEPDEIYHLAAQSSVAESFRSPAVTMHVNTRPVINLLESIRTVAKETRFYHASSSEMYGNVDQLPISEKTLFKPVSPYAVSKVAAHQTVSCYRESYDLFAVSGVLFNHESILRRKTFFTRKLIRDAIDIANGKKETIRFGNLDVRRDFGFAPAYVDAMWRMLQQPKPYDFLICSGRSVALRELVEYVFNRLEIDTNRIQIDPSLFRPSEIPDIYGTNEMAKQKLNWLYDLTAFDVMDLLIDETLKANKVD
jgi:GDPmannose 4,6-dehydratase